jgi:D-aminoacyl-tRNA deacylase
MMRLLVQRVDGAQVQVDNQTVGAITGPGLLVLVGLHVDDTAALFPQAVQKLCQLRIFPNDQGKMNRSVMDVGGGLLLVSQFTLYGECQKGNRPSFTTSMPGPQARPLFDAFVAQCEDVMAPRGLPVAIGAFGASMSVSLVNQGPVTLMLEF